MELKGEAQSMVAADTSEGSSRTRPAGAVGQGGPDTETSTMILRRCTALAARARVDLMTPGRGRAASELETLLAEIAAWDPRGLEAPDPTMTVLAAAALQDLAERLLGADQAQTGAPCTLAAAIGTVLEILREIMAGGRVDVPA